MADLAKLVVSLEAQTAKYQKGLERAEKRSERFAKKAKSNVATVAKAFAGLAIGNSLKNMITQFADSTDAAGKFSTRIGISVEALSQLQFAAERSGVSARTLEMGLQRMTRRLAEAAATGKGEAVPALEALGLSADKMAKLRPEQQFAVLAKAFQDVGTQGEKVRLAMKLFDSEGVALLQTLDGGAEGLKEMADQADRLGITLSEKDTKAAADFNDAITNLKAGSKGFSKEIFANLGPQLTALATQLGELLPLSARTFSQSFVLMQSTVTGAAGLFSHITGLARKSASSILASFGTNSLSKVLDEQGDAAFKTAENLFDQMLVTFEEGMKRIDDQVEKNKKNRENPFDIDRSAVEGDGGGTAVTPIVFKEGLGTEQKKRIAEINAELVRGQQIFEATRTPLENLQSSFAEFNDLLFSGVISQETYFRAMASAQDKFDSLTETVGSGTEQMSTFADEAARNMQDSFADFLFDPFQDGLDGMLKGFLKVIQRMVAEQAAAQLFGSKESGGFGLGDIIKTGISAAIPGLASGGRATAGEPHIIGEVGPELFIPDTSGTVIPNDMLGKSGGNTVVMNITTPDAGSFRKAQSRINLDSVRQLARA